jgi:hypothetical protein
LDLAIDILLWLHVALGAVGLVLYWIPIFAVKGGRVHVRFGRYFVWCAYGLIVTALLLCVIRLFDPPESVPRAVHIFLGYIAIVTLGFVRQAVLVVRTRRDPQSLTSDRLHHGLGILCLLVSVGIILVGILGDPATRMILISLSPIGFVAGSGILSFRRSPKKTPRAWWYAHMVAIIGAGIAFHTAFAVFGASRWIRLSGPLQILPWIAPTLIGVPGMILWVRSYKKKFGEA